MLTKLVNKQPDYLDAAISLSDAFCEQERYKEALSIMNESLRQHPNNFDIYYNMGMIYTMLNDGYEDFTFFCSKKYENC